MANACLFIGFDRPHHGKENDAYKWLMTEGTAALDAFQKEGYYESREHIALTAHGGDLNGFILLLGERAKLDEMRRTDAFEAFVMKLGTNMANLGVIPGVTSAGMQAVMQRAQKIFS